VEAVSQAEWEEAGPWVCLVGGSHASCSQCGAESERNQDPG
jgi:hypothetical protein